MIKEKIEEWLREQKPRKRFSAKYLHRSLFRLNVSRSAINRALNILRDEGKVELRPRGRNSEWYKTK